MPILNFPSEIKEEMVVSIPENVMEVFDFVAIHFLQNYRKWSPEVDLIESLSVGEFGLYSQFRQVRSDKNVLSEVILMVTRFDPPHHFAYSNSKDHYQCQFSFEAVDVSSTQLTFAFLLEDIDVVMRPFSKLLRTSIRNGIVQTANNIKQLLNRKPAHHQGG